MKLTAGFKKFLMLLVFTGLMIAGYQGWKNGYFASKEIAPTELITVNSVAPTQPAPLQHTSAPMQTATAATATPRVESIEVAAPRTTTPVVTSNTKYTAKMVVIPWNAQTGLHFANGGPTTTPGSLMAKHGVSLTVERQDMYDQILSEQIKFAKQVSDGVAYPTEGAAFAIIMGDGYPAYIAGAQHSLSKLGQQLQVIAAVGYSRGEDKCMMPIEVKEDPNKARGVLIGGVKGDGDINICLKWASDNNIPVNPDGSTYDPTALNFAYVDSFVKADDNLIAGYSETRPVVVNGKKTGEMKTITQRGTATWTPGDVKVARMIGGIASIASTKEYLWQMPSIIIGNKQWMEQNPAYVEGMLAAAFEGGELVRSDDKALLKGSTVAAKVFNEETPEYWAKYFKGVVERDRDGNAIELGGSTTNGLGDNAFLFGLNGNDNLYKRVYSVYGGIVSKLYPELLPTLIPYEQVVNPIYIDNLLKRTVVVAQAKSPEFSPAKKVVSTFAKRSYSIEFETGKDTFSPRALDTLNDLIDQLSVSGLAIQINGHTDNVGNQAFNVQLSKSRAEAVKIFLSSNAPSTFPIDRIRTRGYGDVQPVDSNTTSAGRAKNRRVDILLVETESN